MYASSHSNHNASQPTSRITALTARVSSTMICSPRLYGGASVKPSPTHPPAPQSDRRRLSRPRPTCFSAPDQRAQAPVDLAGAGVVGQVVDGRVALGDPRPAAGLGLEVVAHQHRDAEAGVANRGEHVVPLVVLEEAPRLGRIAVELIGGGGEVAEQLVVRDPVEAHVAE